eukprot:GFUD01072205.1.p1 GENE.GFUD01072205.1~~GFUD01072205.1.p1  ORF type:complete len:132 (-),score=21.18 GFUD01072205.1:35-388(-)
MAVSPTYTLVFDTRLIVGSSTLGDSTVTENWCLAVPARLVAKQVYVPESGSSSLAIVSIWLLTSGLPLWSQDMVGLGLPRASHASWRDEPGSFLIKLWRPRVFLVNTGQLWVVLHFL